MSIKANVGNIYVREDARPMYARNFVSDVADRMIRDNYFSAEEVRIVREAEYKSTTVSEFQKNLEEMLYGAKREG